MDSWANASRKGFVRSIYDVLCKGLTDAATVSGALSAASSGATVKPRTGLQAIQFIHTCEHALVEMLAASEGGSRGPRS